MNRKTVFPCSNRPLFVTNSYLASPSVFHRILAVVKINEGRIARHIFCLTGGSMFCAVNRGEVHLRRKGEKSGYGWQNHL